MFKAYKHAISPPRLEAYRRKGDDDLETITRCVWNIALCEALYPTLQHFEIGLRNALHRAAELNFNSSLWFKLPFLEETAKQDITNAENEIRKRDGENKIVLCITEGRIIAELQFGFWTRLFSKRYEPVLWNNKLFSNAAFPNTTNRFRRRADLAQRVHSIRILRNRIFHHEPIIKLNLGKHHSEILEMMEWIEPVLNQTNKIIDRFPLVSTATYYNELKEKLKAEN